MYVIYSKNKGERVVCYGHAASVKLIWQRHGCDVSYYLVSNDPQNCEIRSFRWLLDNNSSPLGHDAMSIGKQFYTFRWSLSLLSSGYKK